jgi:hypothetical protein
MKKNKNGRIILSRCEICGDDLTKEEQDEYGNECAECIEDLRAMFRRIDERYSFKRVNGELIIEEKQKPAK